MQKRCGRCGTWVAAERLEYGATGDLICASCSATSLQRSHSQGESLTRAQGLLFVGLAIGGMGTLSSVLAPTGMNLKILSWIDDLGPAVGWGIRFALMLVGGALALLGARSLGKANKR